MGDCEIGKGCGLIWVWFCMLIFNIFLCVIFGFVACDWCLSLLFIYCTRLITLFFQHFHIGIEFTQQRIIFVTHLPTLLHLTLQLYPNMRILLHGLLLLPLRLHPSLVIHFDISFQFLNTILILVLFYLIILVYLLYDSIMLLFHLG